MTPETMDNSHVGEQELIICTNGQGGGCAVNTGHCAPGAGKERLFLIKEMPPCEN